MKNRYLKKSRGSALIYAAISMVAIITSMVRCRASMRALRPGALSVDSGGETLALGVDASIDARQPPVHPTRQVVEAQPAQRDAGAVPGKRIVHACSMRCFGGQLYACRASK